jgi:hypothetical protein
MQIILTPGPTILRFAGAMDALPGYIKLLHFGNMPVEAEDEWNEKLRQKFFCHKELRRE